TLYLLPPSRPARRSPLFPYTTLFRSLLASIAAPSFRSSHAGACRRAASSKAGFNIRRGNQVARLRRRARLLDLLRQPGIVLLCFFLLGHVTAHEVAKKLGSSTVMGFGGVGKLSLQAVINSKSKSGITHGTILMCYTQCAV